jgi:hypothetical protein
MAAGMVRRTLSVVAGAAKPGQGRGRPKCRHAFTRSAKPCAAGPAAMRRILPFLLALLAAGMPSVQAGVPEAVCEDRQALYCVFVTLSDVAISCVAAGDGYDCEERAFARVEARSLLPGEARMQLQVERVTCPGPGACDQPLETIGFSCSWQAGGCVMEHAYARSFHVAVPEGACFYHATWFHAHGSVRVPGAPLAAGSRNVAETRDFQSGAC